MDTESKQVRLSAVGIVAISLFLALFVRLWFLQGIDRQEFEAASVSNRLAAPAPVRRPRPSPKSATSAPASPARSTLSPPASHG